ncbi:MAG: DUF302 domain-containing protein [Acidimicrobiales bacterium]
METPGFFGIGHLDLSVSDVEASAVWYAQVLGLARLRRVAFADRTMIVLRHESSGLVIGLNQHRGAPRDHFDERRVGLDHVGFAVARREDLDAWRARLVTLGVEHSPVTDAETGSALVFRDPDHIQLELWWSKATEHTSEDADDAGSAARTDGLIERSSPLGVAETVARLVDAATAAGVTVFATVDHAAGARSVGLEMPDTQVVLLGNPAIGTPAMQAAPELALDLPTRVLVRQAPSPEGGPGAPRSAVVFADPVAVGRRYGLTREQVAGLTGIVGLVDRALASATGTSPR